MQKIIYDRRKIKTFVKTAFRTKTSIYSFLITQLESYIRDKPTMLIIKKYKYKKILKRKKIHTYTNNLYLL